MILRINHDIYRSIIKDLRHASPKKIQAIKKLRKEANCGLREAKVAIERYMHDNQMGNYPESAVGGHRIHVGPLIKKIIVDYGSGDIEVDIDSMELRALMDMQTIGLEACGDILDLVKALKEYSAGKKIGVINGDET